MKLYCNGTWLDAADDATVASVTAQLPPPPYGEWVVIHEKRLLEPTEVLFTLGYRDGASLSLADSRCTHQSPFDPERGYPCGWC